MAKRIHSGLILLLALGVTVGAIIIFRHYIHLVDDWMMKLGIFGPIFAILLYTGLSITPIPTDPLTIMLGALYGPFIGLIISWFGNTSAALTEYFIAHHMGSITSFDTLKHRLPWGLARAPVDSIWFLTLGRIAPGYGSKVVSVLSGLYHVPLKTYLWTTALMSFLGSVGYVIGGHLLLRL